MTLTELAQSTVLTASVDADGEATIIRLRGGADVFTLPVAIDALARVIADFDGPVVVDLTDTDFIDTATVRIVGRAWRLLGDRGRSLTVRSPSPTAVRLLKLFGLSHVIEPDRTAPLFVML